MDQVLPVYFDKASDMNPDAPVFVPAAVDEPLVPPVTLQELEVLVSSTVDSVELALKSVKEQCAECLRQYQALKAGLDEASATCAFLQERVQGFPDTAEFAKEKEQFLLLHDRAAASVIDCTGNLSGLRDNLAGGLRVQQHLEKALSALVKRDVAGISSLAAMDEVDLPSGPPECGQLLRVAQGRMCEVARRQAGLRQEPGFGAGPRRTAKKKR